MSRDNEQVNLMRARLDMADMAVDTHLESTSFERPVKVTSVRIIPGLPLDTDGDTVAVDVSYSTDGFSASDVEIAALAATEFNDTDNDLGTVATAVDIALTTASLDSDGVSVRVPANAVIRTTITATGSSADGYVDVVVNGILL